jgi:uncharacterized membrane protein HdeD (DUF308 family)
MIGINYTASFGVLLIFAGYYCFKAVLSKNTFVDKEGEVIRKNISAKNKAVLIISGIISVITGLLLMIKALPANVF